MPGYRVLLMESDEYSVKILEKHIHWDFPDVEVDTASSPAATIQLLEDRSYDLIICDAFLRHEERIWFVGQMCRARDLFLIVITGDTDITAETFSPHVGESCVHHVLYKPLDVKALSLAIQCAIRRTSAKREGRDDGGE